MKDRQGIELKIGQKVAYNLSGGVALGEIVSIDQRFVENLSDWGCRNEQKFFNILVRPDSFWKSAASKRGVSKVTAITSKHGDLVDKIVVIK